MAYKRKFCKKKHTNRKGNCYLDEVVHEWTEKSVKGNVKGKTAKKSPASL
jgi:hypothetical protein